MSESIARSALITIIAGFLFIGLSIVTDNATGHYEVYYTLNSPVPLYHATANTVYTVHGWGGVAGSSVLQVNKNEFWSLAKKNNNVWIVKDSYGWHILTIGNSSLAYELRTITFNEAAYVVYYPNKAVFYTYTNSPLVGFFIISGVLLLFLGVFLGFAWLDSFG